MEMRDRLTELIINAPKLDCIKGGRATGKTYQTVQNIADHILADGWIRPPVRVGSKVYKISRNKVKECEVVFVGISADEKCSHFNFVENYADGTFYKSYSMVFDVIGKTVFLTKDEAKRHLQKGVKNEKV